MRKEFIAMLLVALIAVSLCVAETGGMTDTTVTTTVPEGPTITHEGNNTMDVIEDAIKEKLNQAG